MTVKTNTRANREYRGLQAAHAVTRQQLQDSIAEAGNLRWQMHCMERKLQKANSVAASWRNAFISLMVGSTALLYAVM